MNYKKYLLEITIFFSGAVVMIFELAGSRILGPYFGTSVFVWTSLIGIILASLSLGYYIGGVISDIEASIKKLSLIFFLSSLLVLVTIFFKDILLSFLQGSGLGVKAGSLLAAFILFSPASIFLGIITPYAVKLKLKNLEKSGTTVGILYAISTMGSIFGTFLAGFYLIPNFGVTNILFILVFALMIISFLLSLKYFIKKKFFVLLLVLALWGLHFSDSGALEKNNYYKYDTLYNHVEVYDFLDRGNKEPARILRINNSYSSAMFLEKDDLVFEYTKYYNLAEHFIPNFKNALMIGGAAYSYPKEFLRRYEEAKLDVVEIDPKLTEIAKKHFNLKDDNRLNIIHEDGRTFLNRSNKKYDVIYGDAFKSQNSLPFHLTTKEAVEKKYDMLNSDGVVI